MATLSLTSKPASLDSHDRQVLTRNCAAALWALLALFVMRVAGQMMVAFAHVGFLTPMSEWYSGLLPYPILLPVQWVIVAIFTAVCIDISRGAGAFSRPVKSAGTFLAWFSAIYFTSMAARYAITMAIHPERRWFGTGTIPIFFHFVLAGYLFVLSRYHSRLGGLQME